MLHKTQNVSPFDPKWWYNVRKMSKDNLPYVLSVVFRVFVVFSVAWNWHPRPINRIISERMLNIILKGGFSCHPGDLSRKCHFCHGLCESRKPGTRPPSSHCKTVRNIFDGDQIAIYQSLLLFLGLTYRALPLRWDKYWIISRWLTAYSRCCIDVHRSSCIWSSCWLREFIHVAVVYANEMPLFIGNIEFYIQSTINF